MERMVEAYQREQWARYDAKQAALAEARRALQREVHEARQHQIADKAAARAAAAAEDAAARQRLAEEGARTAELEAAARARAAADALRQRLDLQGKARAAADSVGVFCCLLYRLLACAVVTCAWRWAPPRPLMRSSLELLWIHSFWRCWCRARSIRQGRGACVCATGERAVQAAYDEQRRRVEGQEKARELELAREQEAAYLERVRAAGEHTPPAHFGRPKVQWFY